jgi:hypothetical protein
MKLTTQAALAAGFLLLFAAVILGAFLTADRNLVTLLSQGLLNIVIAVASFYFGSSQGSQTKDATIQAALTPPAVPPTDPQPGDPE